MKTRLLAVVFLVSFFNAVASPPEEDGRLIFNTRCAACHNVNKTLTGPALAGVDQRRSIGWIVNFVQSSQSMVKSGDKDAVAVFEQFNRIPMPDHTDLAEADIKNIVSYIKSTATESTVSSAPFRKPGQLRPSYVPVSFTRNITFFVSFFAAIVLLIAALLLWVRVKEIERESATGSI
jgi:cytochrome c2